MTTESSNDGKPMRGTFRFLNVRVGAGNYRNMEVELDGSLSVTEITSSKTEEEIRAAMLADGYIEVDRDGHPISILDNILRNEKAHAILQDAVKRLKKIGIEGLVQPLVSPVDHTVGWYLIVAKDHADVKCLRALLTAGCDVCGADHAQYARALDMISVLEEQA